MKARISLLLPTRGRLALVDRLFQSLVKQTDDLGAVEVILYVDEDDTASHSILHDRLKLIKIIGPRTTMGACNTACLKLASGEIIVLMNDDMVARSKGWDSRLLNMNKSMQDGIYLAYANDLYMREKLSIIPILSKKTCELLIEPYPRHYPGGFIDYHLFDIFKRLAKKGYDRILFQEDVVFEHLHHRMGKSEFDQIYQRRGRIDLGDEVFVSLKQYRQGVTERLVAAITGVQLSDPPKMGVIESFPDNFIAICLMFVDVFLCDKDLPFRWRLYLFAVFIKRYLSKKFQR